jgi:preprotein translocase subunit SecG
MRAHARALRVIWAVSGVVAVVVLIFGSASDALIFSLAFGSGTGSYAGQAGDRNLAWHLLAWLAVAWVFVLAAMIWPAIRWRRRGMYAAGDPAAQPDPAGEPAR